MSTIPSGLPVWRLTLVESDLVETTWREKAKPRWRLNARWRQTVEGYLFAGPWILGFLALQLGPIVASAWLSLNRWDLLTPSQYVGLQNYLHLPQDALFVKSLLVTSQYVVVAVPLELAVALLLAVLVNGERPLMYFFRGVFFVPSVTTGVAVALLWRWLFNPEFGLVNYLLSLVGIRGPLWLGSEVWALPALILMGLWGVGSTMLIYLAALQGVPQQYYEAAEMDGASRLRQFLSITIPLISSTIFFTLIMGIISSFQVFTTAWVMTRGGPHYATYFYVLHLYTQAFRSMNMGYASALAWVLLAIIMAITLMQFKLSGHWVYYEGQER